MGEEELGVCSQPPRMQVRGSWAETLENKNNEWGRLSSNTFLFLTNSTPGHFIHPNSSQS